MTAPKWDYLPPDWTAHVRPIEAAPEDPDGPFFGGIHALNNILSADVLWRNLTKPQRELLLSSVAGFPVLPRADVKARMVARGLITESLEPTEAGRFVVQWRLP